MGIAVGVEAPWFEVRRVASPDVVTTSTGFTDFVSQNQRALVGFATVVCGSRDEAEDVVQDVLARAYLKWDRIGAEGMDTLAYLHRMVINQRNSLWRRAFRCRELPTDQLPEVAGAATELDDGMWAHVLALPPRQRQVIALRFYLDLSVAESAAMLECSEGTIKSQTHHALASLREAVLRERRSA